MRYLRYFSRDSAFTDSAVLRVALMPKLLSRRVTIPALIPCHSYRKHFLTACFHRMHSRLRSAPSASHVPNSHWQAAQAV